MTKDEALAFDLALEALGLYQAAGFGNSTDANKQHEAFYKAQTATTAIKQSIADTKQDLTFVQPVAWFKHGPYEDGEPLSVVLEDPHDDVCYSPLGFIDTQPAAQPAPVPDLTHDQWDEWQDKHGLILERDALDDLRAMLNTPPAAPVQEPSKHLQLALEALAPLEKLFKQADSQGLLTGANVDCQIATSELRKSAYAASDIRAHLNTTPPAAQPAPVQPVADTEIKNAYIASHGTDDGWLGIEGSYYISGYQSGRKANPPAAQRQWVELTELQLDMLVRRFGRDPMKLVLELTQELKEKNT